MQTRLWPFRRRIDKRTSEHSGAFFELVGMVTLSWALMEMAWDLANELIMEHAGGHTIEPHLPASLTRKLSFTKKAHARLDVLAPHTPVATKLIEGVAALKEKRHDLIHGFVDEHTPEGFRDVIRLRHEGPVLGYEKRRYSVEDLKTLNIEIVALAKVARDYALGLAQQFGSRDPTL
jgi:hypothetical protein